MPVHVQEGITTVTASYTVTEDDYTVLADATSNTITVTLPTAVGGGGRKYTVKKIDSTANTVTVDGNGSETIDGDTTKIITGQYDALQLQSDGSNWFIV